jgi:hypothetical protein
MTESFGLPQVVLVSRDVAKGTRVFALRRSVDPPMNTPLPVLPNPILIVKPETPDASATPTVTDPPAQSPPAPAQPTSPPSPTPPSSTPSPSTPSPSTPSPSTPSTPGQ